MFFASIAAWWLDSHGFVLLEGCNPQYFFSHQVPLAWDAGGCQDLLCSMLKTATWGKVILQGERFFEQNSSRSSKLSGSRTYRGPVLVWKTKQTNQKVQALLYHRFLWDFKLILLLLQKIVWGKALVQAAMSICLTALYTWSNLVTSEVNTNFWYLEGICCVEFHKKDLWEGIISYVKHPLHLDCYKNNWYHFSMTILLKM